ncbi:MAG: hypothetical protein ACE5KF_02620 [Kiloniellaceae bacterium]
MPETQSPTIMEDPPGDERIVFTADEFEGTTPQRVKFTDVWQREEYALFRGCGVQAEIVYTTVTEDSKALEYNYLVERTANTWNLNKKYNKVWGAYGTVRALLGEFVYKPYALTERNRECFGFSSEWDHPPDDPEHRPGKILFGYFCANEGDKISEYRIENLIQRIGIRGVTEAIRKRRGNRHGSGSGVAATSADARLQTEAAVIGQGLSPSAETGNASFPFKFARHYEAGNGGFD